MTNIIIDGLIGAVYAVLAYMVAFFQLLPDASLPVSVQTAVIQFGSMMYPILMLVPFEAVNQSLWFLTVLFLGLCVYKFIRFGKSFIPTMGN